MPGDGDEAALGQVGAGGDRLAAEAHHVDEEGVHVLPAAGDGEAQDGEGGLGAGAFDLGVSGEPPDELHGIHGGASLLAHVSVFSVNKGR
jgi:hypothetical protein